MLHILGHIRIVDFKSIVGLRHKLANLRPMGPSQLHCILFVDFMVSYSVVFAIRREVSVLDIASLSILREMVLLKMLLLD